MADVLYEGYEFVSFTDFKNVLAIYGEENHLHKFLRGNKLTSKMINGKKIDLVAEEYDDSLYWYEADYACIYSVAWQKNQLIAKFVDNK